MHNAEAEIAIARAAAKVDLLEELEVESAVIYENELAAQNAL